MPSFRAGDIVKVPFPYVDVPVLEARPALVVSDTPIGPDGALFWALMITSAANRGWPGDVPIENFQACGLTAASVIRTEKIGTLEIAKATALGRLDKALFDQVKVRLKTILGRFAQ